MPNRKTRNIAIAKPTLGEEEWQALREPLESGWLTHGPQVAAFEKEFAARHRVDHALATTSCTTGLHLILVALGIGPGDEVIVPSFTWVASANAVVYCGAKPVLADVETETFNIDPKQVRSLISERTKAIIAVHLFGLCVDMDALREAANGVPIIEDAACAAGASFQGQPAGSLATAGCFSFHPRKTITTGEGGMVTTSNERLAETMTMMRNHGASISEEQRHHGAAPYLLPDFNTLGFNYRMTDLQGAVGRVQLSKLDELIDERNAWAEYYQRELASVNWLTTPKVADGCRHGWQAFVCMVDQDKAPCPRDEMMQKLLESGINTRPGTHSVAGLGYYKTEFGTSPSDYPMSERCALQSMALPLHNQMSDADFEYVVHTIKAIEA